MSASPYGSSNVSRPVAEMNITPLVDVMLVLLVIFMMAVPVVARPLDVNLPRGGAGASPPRVTLEVTTAGEYVLDGQPLSREALGLELQSIARQAPRTVLEIRASEDGEYQAFATALSTAQSSGLHNIAL